MFNICSQIRRHFWSAGFQELVAHREKSRQLDTTSGRRYNCCSCRTGSYFFKVVAGGIKRQQIPDQKESAPKHHASKNICAHRCFPAICRTQEDLVLHTWGVVSERTHVPVSVPRTGTAFLL